MVTRFLIVTLALFVILGEVRSLRCYVCENCPAVLKGAPNVEERDNCSACVIEDKFELRKYLQTDRSCAPCPDHRLVMINNNKSYYHCCRNDLCLGENRRAWDEIPSRAKPGVMLKTTTVDHSGKVTTTKPDIWRTQCGEVVTTMHPTSETATLSMGSSATENDQSGALKPTLSTARLDTVVTSNNPITANPTTMTEGTEKITELERETDGETSEASANTATHQSESSSTAAEPVTVLNTASSMQSSGAAVTSVETTTAKSTTAVKSEEITPNSPNKPSTQTTAETVTGNVGSSSTANPQTSAMNPTLPTQPVDTDTTPDDFTTTNTITVTKRKEIPKSTNKIEHKYTEIPAETTTENLESASPTTCQTNVRYLAFSLSLICGLVTCFN